MIPVIRPATYMLLCKPRASGDDPTVYRDGIKKTA